MQPSPDRSDYSLTTFRPDRTAVIARAPARLDVMDGIADYSGATVLEFPWRGVPMSRRNRPMVR